VTKPSNAPGIPSTVAGVATTANGRAADRAAGYRYELSILQAEFSLAQMLDKPVVGGYFSNRSSATTSISAAPATYPAASHLADHTAAPPLEAASRAYNAAVENLCSTALLTG
jgi:hypothetical protein